MIVVLLTTVLDAIVSPLVVVVILGWVRRKAIYYGFDVDVVYHAVPMVAACGAICSHLKCAELIWFHLVLATILRFVVPLLVALALVPIVGLVAVVFVSRLTVGSCYSVGF